MAQQFWNHPEDGDAPTPRTDPMYFDASVDAPAYTPTTKVTWAVAIVLMVLATVAAACVWSLMQIGAVR